MGCPAEGGPGLGPIMLWAEPGEGPGLGPNMAPGDGPGPGEGPGRGVPPRGGSGVDIFTGAADSGLLLERSLSQSVGHGHRLGRSGHYGRTAVMSEAPI